MPLSKPFIQRTIRKGGHSAAALVSCRADAGIGRAGYDGGNSTRAFAASASLQLNAEEI
jgi:hypothetical protein